MKKLNGKENKEWNGMEGHNSSSFCFQQSTKDGIFIKAKVDKGIRWSEERVNVSECSCRL